MTGFHTWRCRCEGVGRDSGCGHEGSHLRHEGSHLRHEGSHLRHEGSHLMHDIKYSI